MSHFFTSGASLDLGMSYFRGVGGKGGMRREGSKLEVDFKEGDEECDDVLDIEQESGWVLVSEVGDVTMIVMGLLEVVLWVLG